MTVRMSHPRLGTRAVKAGVVEKLRQNGWSVVEPDPPPKKRRKPDSKPSETDSGGFLMPEHEKES